MGVKEKERNGRLCLHLNFVGIWECFLGLRNRNMVLLPFLWFKLSQFSDVELPPCSKKIRFISFALKRST